MRRFLDSLSINLAQKALDMRQIRQKLISSNIANADTPSYASTDIAFEKQLKEASISHSAHSGILLVTHPRHLQLSGNLENLRPTVITPAQAAINNDLNSVDVETELMKMAHNNTIYEALVVALHKQMQGIDYAIREGGK